MKKKNLFKRRHESDEMSLQITSMADIFMILLVFLLKSYSSGTASISPSKTTMLPEAHAGTPAMEALKVEITQGSIQVEGQPIVALNGFTFAADDLQGNGSSKVLSKALERERQKQLLIAKVNTDVKIDPKIIVIADQKVPFGTLKSVLASAAVNGYTDFKLAVVSRD